MIVAMYAPDILRSYLQKAYSLMVNQWSLRGCFNESEISKLTASRIIEQESFYSIDEHTS